MSSQAPAPFYGTTRQSATNRRRVARTLIAAGSALALASCSASGGEGEDNYPTEAIEYVVPYNPGGSSDPLGREYSRMLGENLGTSTTVLNVPGGDESIGLTQVSTADPDGYTLGLGSSAGLLAQPMLNEQLQYDGREDFTPIVKMADTPYVLLVAADSPYQTLEDFVAAAKENPGELRVGTANRMGNSAFVLYELERQAGIETTIVPSSGGSGESALSVMGGRIEAFIATASGQLGLVESGDLRALAYTGDGYEEFLPDATSFEEAGYDIPFSADYMTLAPAGMPEEVRDELVTASQEVTQSEEWASWSKDQGNLPDSLTGEELDAHLDEQRENIQEAIEFGQSRD